MNFEYLTKAEEKITVLESQHEINSKHSHHLTNSLNAALADLGTFQEREQSLLDRELKCIKTEVENEYLVKGNADKMTLMLSLTRNLEHRRNLFDDRSGNTGPDGQWVNNTVKAEETAEAK
jgi:hypothetical protein